MSRPHRQWLSRPDGDQATFSGRMPDHAGDLSVESQGITPVPSAHRYGAPARLFTVWFAPNITMTGVFTGTLAVTLGLGFWRGLVAMLIGTALGALPVAYLSTIGPRTGTSQLAAARMPFGSAVVLPGLLQWLSSIAWDGLVGLFGGQALAALLGIPFWLAVLLVLAVQCAVAVVGYEFIHRTQAVLTVLLAVVFGVLAVRLIQHGHVLSAPTLTGGSLAGAFVLEVTIAMSATISWASYAADFSRYLPADTPPRSVARSSFAGVFSSYALIQALGIAAAGALVDQSATGVRHAVGGGFLGNVALLAVAVAAIGSNAMNDYSGSLALQAIGVRVRRPVSAVVGASAAFLLVLWLHSGDVAAKFTNVLLFVGYWIPGFVAVVGIDWIRRVHSSRLTGSPDIDRTTPASPLVAVLSLVGGFVAALPFVNTSLFVGWSVAALHGADIAYFVAFVVTAALYLLLGRLAPHARPGANLPIGTAIVPGHPAS